MSSESEKQSAEIVEAYGGKLPKQLLPSRKQRNLYIFISGCIVFVASSLALMGVNPMLFFTEFDQIADLIGAMFPPRFDILVEGEIWSSIGQTLAMAFLGTFFGGILAFIIAFFSAQNTTPSRWLRMAGRTLLGAQRCAPDFAIMMVIVVAVGFGPFAGTLALIIGSTGVFGKFFADAIEHIEEAQLDSVRVVGATRLQVIRYGVLPQVLPSFVANSLYLFEVNVGGAIALGVFQGGGLGFQINLANAFLDYPKMLTYIIFIVVLLICVEKGSDFIRKRLLGRAEALK
jgi:phosphonate transport system permease protein